MGYVAEISASLQHCAGVAALSASLLEKCAWGSAFLHTYLYMYTLKERQAEIHAQGHPQYMQGGGEGRW
jgi:hypothetical protein